MSNRMNRGDSVYRYPLSTTDIFVKAFNPKQVKPTVYIPYESSSLGQIIIDNNKDLSPNKKLFNLLTKAPVQENFELIVDINFEEFIEDTTDDTIQILEARLNALSAQLAGEQSSNAVLQAEIDALRAQLAALLRQPTVNTQEIINTVPDTMVLNSVLYDDRTGAPGAPNYPIKQNMLLSKGRKSRLVIQGDGNVVITLGEFDKDGNQIREDEIVAAFGWSNGEIAPNFLLFTRDNSWQADKKDVLFTVGGLSPTWQARYNGPKIRTSKVTSTPRLTLTDEGLINVYEGQQLLWTSYGFDFPTGGTTFNYIPKTAAPATTTTPATTSNDPIIEKYRTSFSNQNAFKINFRKSDGSDNNVLLSPLDTNFNLNVELITYPATGQQIIKFKVPYNAPAKLPIFSARSLFDRDSWSNVTGDDIETDYKASDWTQLNPR